MKRSRKQSVVCLDALLNSCVCQCGIHPEPILNTLLSNVKLIAIHPGNEMIT
ncbi:putative signal peptide protein [Puccinia sorghi]|uniref:Putative signal peptide protein n=1 Tax=Puccinia sorghi TaxID=27349 RepID=A0A0L6UN98_9BASI|nr:putative signal peptide protein [Puccinia sorghi]